LVHADSIQPPPLDDHFRHILGSASAFYSAISPSACRTSSREARLTAEVPAEPEWRPSSHTLLLRLGLLSRVRHQRIGGSKRKKREKKRILGSFLLFWTTRPGLGGIPSCDPPMKIPCQSGRSSFWLFFGGFSCGILSCALLDDPLFLCFLSE
jgi:hypothetical protein